MSAPVWLAVVTHEFEGEPPTTAVMGTFTDEAVAYAGLAKWTWANLRHGRICAATILGPLEIRHADPTDD